MSYFCNDEFVIKEQFIIRLVQEALPELADFFNDIDVTEISICNGGRVFVQKDGVSTEVEGHIIPEMNIVVALKAIQGQTGSTATTGGDGSSKPKEASYLVNATFQSMRISGALFPVSPDGSLISIRKHLDPSRRPTLEQLVEWGALSKVQADYVVREFTKTENPVNILIVGGTNTGKTTYANALLKALPDHVSLLTIEDNPELSTNLPNLKRLISNGEMLPASELVKIALRLSPDRIVLGETRGNETFDLIRAFNSGHPGSVTTVHANSAREGLQAIEMLYQMSLPKDASIATEISRAYIASAFQLVIFIKRIYVATSDGRQKMERKVREIVLIKGVSHGEYVLEAVNEF